MLSKQVHLLYLAFLASNAFAGPFQSHQEAFLNTNPSTSQPRPSDAVTETNDVTARDVPLTYDLPTITHVGLGGSTYCDTMPDTACDNAVSQFTEGHWGSEILGAKTARYYEYSDLVQRCIVQYFCDDDADYGGMTGQKVHDLLV